MADVTGEFYVLERVGKRVNVSEEYRRKGESGEWESTGRGYYTLWLKRDDASPEVDEGAVVLVKGSQRIDRVERGGKTYTNVNINVYSIGVVRLTSKYVGPGLGGSQGGSNGQWATSGSGQQSNPPGGQQWAVDDDAPVPF